MAVRYIKNKTKKVKFRDYKQFVRIVEDSSITISDKYLKKFGDEFIRNLFLAIVRQVYPHTPLKPEYKRRKVEAGLDPRILIATWDYVLHMAKLVKIKRGTGFQYQIAPWPGEHSSGLTYGMLAKIHEFGSKKRGIPARPHWKPTFRRMKPGVRKMNKVILQKIKKNVNRGVRTVTKK